MPSVVILGGGIAGLTAAFELASRGFDVTVIERNDIIGGMARSMESPKSSGSEQICPLEYSWRAFGPYYYNTFDVLRRIPLPSKPGKTVFDNLTRLRNKQKHTDCGKTNTLIIDVGKIPTRDKFVVANAFAQYFTSATSRTHSKLSNVNWNDYLAARGISQTTYNQFVRPLGPLFGFDNERASFYDVGRHIEIMANAKFAGNAPFRITKLPINLAWFNPWVAELKRLGVKIITNTTITQILTDDDRVTGVYAKTIGHVSPELYSADYYVSALSLESAAKLLKPLFSIDPKLQQLEPLYEHGRQVQLSVQIYFDRKMYFKIDADYLYLEHSPWAIIILAEGTLWKNNFAYDDYCNPIIQEIWSVGICDTHKPGLYIKKPFVECTPEEVKAETWYQIVNAPGIDSSVCVENGSSVSDARIIDFKIWPSFQYTVDPETGKGRMDTWEPKFGNNTHTKQYRPGYSTKIPNLFVAGSYCDTTVGVHSMDGAVEAGKRASALILDSAKVPNDIYVYTHPRFAPIVMGPLRALDNFAHTRGLPHISAFTLDSSIILLLIYFIVLAFLVVCGARAVKKHIAPYCCEPQKI